MKICSQAVRWRRHCSLPPPRIAGSISRDAAATRRPKGKYTVLPPRLYSEQVMPRASSQSLQTWNGSYSYSGTNYTYNMVGAAPSTNTSASIPVYIIPVKIVVGRNGRQSTFDPAHVLSNGNSVTQNTVDSPLFTSSIDYKLGSIDVGTTQYIDAYQRANFWGTVSSHTNSHLLLGNPTVLPEKTLTVPANYGKTGSPFGFTAGLVDINWFDAQLPNIIAAEGIQPNAFPIFLTYDVYLTQGGSCCIGGYHSAEGNSSNPQAYAEATYVDHPGDFSQDVRRCHTRSANGRTIPWWRIRTATRHPAASWRTAIRSKTRRTTGITPIRKTASPITCRTWQ